MHSPSPTAVRLPNVVLWQLYRRSLHYIGLHTNGNIMHRLDWYIRASDVYYGFLCLVSVGSSDIDPQPASSIHSATAMSRLFQPHWTPEIERTVKHGLYSDHPVGQIMTSIAVGDVEKRTGRLPWRIPGRSVVVIGGGGGARSIAPELPVCRGHGSTPRSFCRLLY